MGRNDHAVDPAELTDSGNRCLGELSRLAVLAQSDSVITEWIVSSAATAVESHFDRVLASLIDFSGIKDSRFASALYDEAVDRIFSTWSARLEWFNKGFGISIKGDEPIQKLILLIDLRNAFVHGAGEITSLQGKNFIKLLELKKNLGREFGASFHGNKILVDPSVRMSAIVISRNAVTHLDRTLRKVCPNWMESSVPRLKFNM